MKLHQIIKLADGAFPDGQVAAAYKQYSKRRSAAVAMNSEPSIGDTLAEFIVLELASTFDPDASTAAQLNEAVRVMENAKYELDDVQEVLQKAADAAARR